MAVKLVVELDQRAKQNLAAMSKPGLRKNIIKNCLVEILRLPEPGVRVPGARVGEHVKGRLVVQYVGPAILYVVDDYMPVESNEQDTSLLTPPKRNKAAVKRLTAGISAEARARKATKAPAKRNCKSPKPLQRASKRR